MDLKGLNKKFNFERAGRVLRDAGVVLLTGVGLFTMAMGLNYVDDLIRREIREKYLGNGNTMTYNESGFTVRNGNTNTEYVYTDYRCHSGEKKQDAILRIDEGGMWIDSNLIFHDHNADGSVEGIEYRLVLHDRPYYGTNEPIEVFCLGSDCGLKYRNDGLFLDDSFTTANRLLADKMKELNIEEALEFWESLDIKCDNLLKDYLEDDILEEEPFYATKGCWATDNLWYDCD